MIVEYRKTYAISFTVVKIKFDDDKEVGRVLVEDQIGTPQEAILICEECRVNADSANEFIIEMAYEERPNE